VIGFAIFVRLRYNVRRSGAAVKYPNRAIFHKNEETPEEVKTV
jgi:hypothetical protein